LSAQEQLLQHGTKEKTDEVLEVSKGSHDLLYNTFLEDEALIITKSDIIEFKDKQIIY
jgi:predicted KAP-like P-loop ATPase